MSTTKILSVLALLAIIAIGAFLYLTRPVAAPTNTSAEVSIAPEGQKRFVLSDESFATFHIYEELNGSPKTVIGTTTAVSGEVVIDPAHPEATVIGPLHINARTFITDNERRNAAIARLILKAEDPANEFIVFTPTKLDGFPEHPQVEQELSFTVTGDLHIMNTTKPVTFNVKAKAESEDRITGVATASVLRSDFGIVVPSLPFLANVGDSVELQLSFVLEAK